jgi:hypothetical protein
MSACAMNFRATVAKRRDMQSSRGLKTEDCCPPPRLLVSKLLSRVDQEIPYQQNMEAREIGTLILCAATNRLRDLQKLVPLAQAVLDSIQLGQVVRVP